MLVNIKRLLGRRAADASLNLLMSASMVLSIVARWPQIILNFRNRGVGQLNLVTTLLYLTGNCIRLYATHLRPVLCLSKN